MHGFPWKIQSSLGPGTLHSCMCPAGAACVPPGTLWVMSDGTHLWGRGRRRGQGFPGSIRLEQSTSPSSNLLNPHVQLVMRQGVNSCSCMHGKSSDLHFSNRAPVCCPEERTRRRQQMSLLEVQYRAKVTFKLRVELAQDLFLGEKKSYT